MKCRRGFVSNSSASSFLVDYTIWQSCTSECEGHSILVLTKREIKLLERKGFRQTWVNYPNLLLEYSDDPEDKRPWENIEAIENDENGNYFGTRYGLSVSCNEMDIIQWLLKHRFSFKAATHYGHYSWFYVRDDVYVYKIPNIGLACETYGISHLSDYDPRDLLPEKIWVSDLLPTPRKSIKSKGKAKIVKVDKGSVKKKIDT